jgi:hypothetical protein
MKKAQITFFMIIGLVLLIVAVFLVYLNLSRVTHSSNQETKTNAGDVEAYVKSCLRDSLKKNLLLLGQQGGVLYTTQNGLTTDFSSSLDGVAFINNNGKKVFYSIDRTTNPSFLSPTYPNQAFGQPDPVERSFTGIFGENRLPPLTKNFGPYSMQEQLEKAILTDVELCSFNSFNGKYDINASSPAVQISFNKLITAKLNYHLKITDLSSKSTSEQFSFSESIPVNMNNMYGLLSGMIHQDVTNLSYSMPQTNVWIGTTPYAIVIKNNVKNFDDLININSTTEKIDGVPFNFAFARKNRDPVLVYVAGTSATTLDEGASIKFIATTPYELKLNSDSYKIIALDPDEDTLNLEMDDQSSPPPIISHNVIHQDVCSPSQLKIIVKIYDGQYQNSQTLLPGLGLTIGSPAPETTC